MLPAAPSPDPPPLVPRRQHLPWLSSKASAAALVWRPAPPAAAVLPLVPVRLHAADDGCRACAWRDAGRADELVGVLRTAVKLGGAEHQEPRSNQSPCPKLKRLTGRST